ncbi:MAG: hypothetical protein CMI92_03155 [Pelagibacteraceae bacterium]|nr:hypothetical protein [Pelagibacteraceae bacterium]
MQWIKLKKKVCGHGLMPNNLSKISSYINLKSINVSVKYLSISALFTGIGLGYFFTLMVMILKHNGYSESMIGLIGASFSFGLMSAGLIVTKILKQIGLYQTMLLSISVQTLLVILMFVFFNPIVISISHFIMGLLGGMNWMTMDTWVNVVSTNKNRGKAIAFYNLSITLGFSIGPLLISLFGTYGSVPIFLAIFLMIIRTPVIISIKKYVESVKLPTKDSKLNFSLLKFAPFIFLAIFVSGIGDSSFGVLFPAYMINLEFSDRYIGILLFVALFFGILSQPFVGALTDTINKRVFIFILLSFHFAWPLILHNFYQINLILFFAVIIWGIAGTSLYTVALAYLGERYNFKEIIAATSVFIIVYEAGEFFGPLISGFMMDIFGNIGFIYSVIVPTVMAFAIGSIRTFYLRKM